MINYVSKSFGKKLSEFSLRSFFLLCTTLKPDRICVTLSVVGFFRTLNSVSYCKRRILKVKNNIRFFLNVQIFYNQVRFEKKNWQLLFENAIKKKKRGGNLNYKTHPVVLFSSVSVTKKERKEQNKDNF